jgi:integrase
MRLAFDLEWRKDDPTYAIKKLKVRSEGYHSWSEAEVAAFEARWPLGTRERLAMALLLLTAQRRFDLVEVGRQHVRDRSINVRQQKTGSHLAIPMHPRLREAIDAHPNDNLTFLVAKDGKPFTSAGFGNWFREACNAAGLPQRSAHGLRKAASRRLAEAGSTAHQIAAVTGHQTLKEVERYTRAANQIRLAGDVMAMIGEDERGTNKV